MVAEVWTKEELMGLKPGEVPPKVEESKSKGKGKGGPKGKGVEENPLLWGLPGHLSEEEADTFFKFKAEIEKRGADFKETIYCFGEEEGEVWALCRWLRARKFVYEDVIQMVEEATETRKDAKAKDFYPVPKEALGVEASLFFALFPQVYSGFAKNGVPLFISKPGILNVDGMECITTLDGIIKFHWHIMMHDFASRLRAQKKQDPEKFKRFESVSVLDLNKLTMAQLSRRALAIIKEQAAIDSVCFPETMNKMLIINAPSFFAATWNLIKGWLDPRTANKVEVISNKAKGEKRLLELVDADQLPSDYGGTGPETDKTMQENFGSGNVYVSTIMMYIRGSVTEAAEIKAGESATIDVHTRSLAGAKFSITKDDEKTPLFGEIEVKHTGEDDMKTMPSFASITPKPIEGPAKIKIKGSSNAGRFSTQNFLLVLRNKK